MTVLFLHVLPPPQSVYKSSHSMLFGGWGGVRLWTDVCHPPPTKLLHLKKSKLCFPPIWPVYWLSSGKQPGLPHTLFSATLSYSSPCQSITTPTLWFELCLSTTTEIKPGTSEMSVFPVYCSSLYILTFSCICIFCFSLSSLCQNISSHREYLNYLCKHPEDIFCSLQSVYFKVHKH